MKILILIATVVFLLWLFLFQDVKKEKAATVQDIIGKDTKVYPDGIIETSDGIFRAAVEVTPVNMTTSSDMEQNNVWLNFRAMLGTIGIPYTLMVQTQYMDIKDYNDWFKAEFEGNKYLNNALKELGNGIIKHTIRTTQEQKTRDFRCYIRLEYAPQADSIDSGVTTGFGVIDDIINKFSKNGNKMSKEEIRDLAQSVLHETIQIIFATAEQLGMQYRKLDREEVYNLTYMTLQKEMSQSVRLKEASDRGSFTPYIESITSQVLVREYEEEG